MKDVVNKLAFGILCLLLLALIYIPLAMIFVSALHSGRTNE